LINFALFLQDKRPWLAEMANWQVNAARNKEFNVISCGHRSCNVKNSAAQGKPEAL
jgi:gluconate kinase